MKTARTGMVIGIAVVALLWACSSSTPESISDAGARSAAACSDGPQYSWDFPFPREDAPAGYNVNGAGASDNPPLCTPHCGTGDRTAGVNVFPYDALPSGAC